MAKFKGKITKSDLEGGFWTLETESGDVYKLEGAGTFKEGARVEVEGAVDEGAMGIGFGAPVLKVTKLKSI